MKIKLIYQITGLMLSLIISGATWSEEIRMYADQVPSSEELADAMFPELATEGKTEVKTRSIRFGAKKNVDEPVGIAMPINFDYGSDDIRSDSKAYLNQIGVMMNMDKLAGQKIIIEGHTDAIGSEEYNNYLSQNRANSVKQYLISNYNISPDRMQTVGKGENANLLGKQPNDPMNRRVQFYRGP